MRNIGGDGGCGCFEVFRARSRQVAVHTASSAARSTHVAIGLLVRVEAGRSQHANRCFVSALLAWRFQWQA